MPNPLSDRGWSDNDYRAAIGTLVGEAAVKGGLQDYQAIADVIANRAQAGVYGRTISGITMNPSQFSTWKDSKKTAEALKSAKAGFAAALNTAVVGRMSPSMQQRVELAKQAVDDVFVNGKARGLTQGATHYHNAKVTARDNTDEYHKKLEKGGFIDIGAHRFSGPTFRDDPFDPITYNGQLAAPPSVDPFLGDIGVPVGQVSALGPVPDLTPSQPASAGSIFGGFDIGDVTLSDAAYGDIIGGLALNDFAPVDYGAAPDIMGQMDGPTFSDITAGTAFDPLSSISPVDYGPMPDVMSQFDGPTYPDMTAGLHDAFPSVGVGQPAQYGEEQAFGSYTPSSPGFSAGFDEGPYGVTPDFDAPSLSARNNVDRFEGAMAVRNASTPTNEDIAASVMSELAPKQEAPQLATPSFDMQSAYAGDWADKFGGPQLSTPSVNTQAAPKAAAARSPSSQPAMGDYSQPAQTVAASRAPASVQAAPGAPQVNGPLSSITGPINSAISSVTDPINSAISSVTNPIKDSLKDMGFGGSTGFTVGGRPGDFLDAMAAPEIANSYRTGAFDGWMGDALQGAALGALTGGPFGALTGAVWGGLNIPGHVGSMLGMANGSLFGNGFGGFFDTMANPYAGMSPQDLAAYGLDGDWTTREPTRNTGFEGGATRGDGSYSDSAGYNDNNPQGIL